MADKLIYIVTILFTLSVISEKLTQLIRGYSWQFKILLIAMNILMIVALIRSWQALTWPELFTILGFVCVIAVLSIGEIKWTWNKKMKKAGIGVLKNIGKNKANKRAQESEVTVLSLLVGIIIAVLFKANLIEMFKVKSFSEIGWDKFPIDFENLQFALTAIDFSVIGAVGFLLTGFFLTFGSKFFHDLLDLLLEAKNQRRNLNQAVDGNEIKLIQLQLDQKGALSKVVSGPEKIRLDNEIKILKDRLTSLLSKSNG